MYTFVALSKKVLPQSGSKNPEKEKKIQNAAHTFGGQYSAISQ